ncbi:hypothetical protein KR093_007264, partial [Drosophila rubida]
RYPYIRRQGSGNGPHNHHHHNSSNSSSTSSSSSSASVTNASHNTQYSNNSINNATSNTNALYAAAVSQQQQSVPISQHDELIRYIRGAWNKVSEQGAPVIICSESDNQLKNFKPFNLEEYWGQRLVQNIHVTTTHQ